MVETAEVVLRIAGDELRGGDSFGRKGEKWLRWCWSLVEWLGSFVVSRGNQRRHWMGGGGLGHGEWCRRMAAAVVAGDGEDGFFRSNHYEGS